MRSINSLPLKNIVKKPASSFALILISAFLALSAFGGTVMVMSLSGGLDSLSARLGADIIVTPYPATSQVSYDSVIIQGKPGQFYMDSKYYEEIKTETEGIDKVTAQFYLASAKASCCSSRLQIIGFDPATDFSIQPWVEKSYSNDLGLYDAVVGSDVTPNTDMTVEIYGKTLHVQAVLDKTGTELDSALYAKESGRKLTEIRRDKIGLIFQQFHLVNYLTAVENVMVSQYYHSMPDEKEALEALERVGLKDRAKHLPSQLSGGEQQRVCIARALINHPEIILADEPTGNLDEANENIVIDIFKQLHRQGTTLIVVTHDPEVAEVAQRTVVLEHGRLVKEIINENFEE